MGGMCWEQGSSEMGAAAHAEGMVGSALQHEPGGIGQDTGHYREAEGSDRLERAAVCERCARCWAAHTEGPHGERSAARAGGIGHDTGHYREAEGSDRLERAAVCERCSA